MELIQEVYKKKKDEDKIVQLGILNGYALRIIATIAMLLGHISEIIEYRTIPISYRWIGNIAGPIFIFLLVQAYKNTDNKYIYIFKIYLSYLLMGIVNGFLSVNIFSESNIIKNNIFGALFLVLLHLILIDYLIDGIKEKNYKKIIFGFFILILPSLVSIIYLLLRSYGYIPRLMSNLIEMIIPMIFFVEDGLLYIPLGIIFYLLNNSRFKQIIGLIFFSLLNISGEFTYDNLLYENIQWMMLFAAPFIMLYNGESIREDKLLSYSFYPLHIYFLYILSYFMNK